MMRITLFALAIAFLLPAQQDWQGDVKQIYKIDVPAFQGTRPIYALAKKTASSPDIELYSVTMKVLNLKSSAEFYRASLEKQGFKPVRASSTATLERIAMVNPARKLGAVVVATKQKDNMMVGVTVLPESHLPKQ